MIYSFGAIPIPSRSNSSLVASVASIRRRGGRFGLGLVSFIFRAMRTDLIAGAHAYWAPSYMRSRWETARLAAASAGASGFLSVGGVRGLARAAAREERREVEIVVGF